MVNVFDGTRQPFPKKTGLSHSWRSFPTRSRRERPIRKPSMCFAGPQGARRVCRSLTRPTRSF